MTEAGIYDKRPEAKTPDQPNRLFLFLAILIETGRKRFCHHGCQEAKTSRCQTKNRRQSTEEKIPSHK